MTNLRHWANPLVVGMLQDQPRHQVGQRCLCLHRQPGPDRHAAGHRLWLSCEQIDLLWHAAAYRCLLALAWHGPLSESDRERDLIRPNRARSALQSDHAGRLAKAFQALRAPARRYGRRPLDALWRRPTDQTSRPESPANVPHRNRSDYSGKRCRPPSRSPREHQSEGQTTDARDTVVPETRFRGCSQALLYNESRPHMALDAATPLEFARKAGLCDERTKQIAVEN